MPQTSTRQKFVHKNTSGVIDPSYHDGIVRWLDAADKGRVLKDNNARTVWIWEPADGPALVVKQYKAVGWIHHVRNFLIGTRAEREFNLLWEMRLKNLAVPPPVAAFSDSTGSSFLVTGFLPSVQPLNELFEKGWAGHASKAKILDTLAAFVRQLHDRGVHNRDLHVGNILIDPERLQMSIIDMQRGSLHLELSWDRRLIALAFIVHSFYTFVTLQDCHRFLAAYFKPEENKKAAIRQVWQLFDRVRFQYYRSRDQHILSSTRTTERMTLPGRGRVWMRHGTDLQWVRSSLDRGPQWQCVKTLPGRALHLDGAGHYVKTIEYRSWGKIFENWFKDPPAFRAWWNAQALGNRGIDTPSCMAAVEKLDRGCVMGEWLSTAEPLNVFLQNQPGTLSLAAKGPIIGALALFVRRLHRRGVFHKDLKANNILVVKSDGAIRFYVIDLDRMSFRSGVSWAERTVNLAQLNAAIGAPMTRPDRLRFFKRYVGRDQALWKNRKRLIRDIMDLTRERKHVWP